MQRARAGKSDAREIIDRTFDAFGKEGAGALAAWMILTGNRVPMITVVMAQFVTEMGLRWNLMAATAVMALVPAFLIALFGQKYVIRGLRI